MKLNQKKPELFIFKDDEYRKRAQNMTPDALWQREMLKYRMTVSSGCSVAFSGIMVVPTLGFSTVGLWYSGRALDIARRKTRIIEAEVDRRKLPHYNKKLRDIFIPLGLSFAVITTVGVIDFLCLVGTSASVLNAWAPHGWEALNAALHHPSQFATAMGHGFEFQGQQFFHVGAQKLGLGLQHIHTAVDHNGFYHCAHSVTNNVANHLPQPPQLGLESKAPEGMSAVKAGVVANIHANMAAQGNQHALSTMVADTKIVTAAMEGKTVALDGANVGMWSGQAGETHAVQFLMEHTGIPNSFQSLTTKSNGVATQQDAEEELLQLGQMTNSSESQEAVEKAFSQALTGEVSRMYVFVTPKGLPISQQITTPSSSQKCQHAHERSPAPTCRFCFETIDPAIQAYYHCCQCSSISSYDLCEVCVAGKGCGCRSRNEHILYRRGFLSGKVEQGELEGVKPPKLFKRKPKAVHINGDESVESQDSKKRWLRRRPRKSDIPEIQIFCDSDDEMPELFEDDFEDSDYTDDLESIYPEDDDEIEILDHNGEMEALEDDSFYSIEKVEESKPRIWNLRSWRRKDKREEPLIPGVNTFV